MKTVEAVKIFRVSRSAIIKWLHIYRKKGTSALDKKKQGRPLGSNKLKGKELDKFIWWDMKEPIPVYEHVMQILKNTMPTLMRKKGE